MNIRRRISSDNPALLALWKRSVTASHTFLTEDDIGHIETDVETVYLPALEVWACESSEGKLLGFTGLNGTKVEMLFVEPAYRGRGVGSLLLDHVRQQYVTLSIDVNAQNTQAHGFYLRYGFKEIGRSGTDDAGRPFPLIRMELKE
ncbi:MAG: GNAT family N-acetyltransferase [Desulfovibrio sp.]|nr:GNAT family N-acetyltransferase [Desulfovibrio sp.]